MKREVIRAQSERSQEEKEGEKQSARGKAIVGLLQNHESNKNHNTMIFPEKLSLRGINLKQLLVVKTLESVKALPYS